jgi:nitrate/nitrite-specific signal transduction histidine kinase
MQNALGQDLNAAQSELMECYEKLARTIADRRDELAPYEERNALKALSALWQVANGLDMDRGHIYHLGA